MSDLLDLEKNLDEIEVTTAVQLLLAGKRTTLALMRTGLAVLALPLSVISVLIATSNHYNIRHVAFLLVPVGILSIALTVLGIYLILHSLIRLHFFDRQIEGIRERHRQLAHLLK